MVTGSCRPIGLTANRWTRWTSCRFRLTDPFNAQRGRIATRPRKMRTAAAGGGGCPHWRLGINSHEETVRRKDAPSPYVRVKHDWERRVETGRNKGWRKPI